MGANTPDSSMGPNTPDSSMGGIFKHSNENIQLNLAKPQFGINESIFKGLHFRSWDK